MNKEIIINKNYKIGKNHKPFIIAEMSANHNQSLKRALKIVKAAHKCGADAIKLQTYTPDTLTLNLKKKEFLIKDKKSLWKGKSLYELYKKAYTPWEWHKPIMKLAKKLGIICFSTPFDETAVDFLEKLKVPIYKIASFESTHLPLIKKVASTGKPIIISTGLASVNEIHDAIKTARSSGCKKIILLKCTSNYPANVKNSNILTIPHMKNKFKCEVGLSDHTLGIGAAIAAVANGATVIEKHLTLKRKEGGVDSSFSMETDDLKKLVIETNRAWKSLGKISYGPTKDEKSSTIFRRSIYVTKNIKNGTKLSKENIRIIRPGLGLAPKYFKKLIGRKIKCNLSKGTALKWKFIR
jgi:pseudaminic acid synthase